MEPWRDFQEKRIRLILAFRHPYGDEPQLFSHAFDIVLPRMARRSGKPLPSRPHARFIHGYEVPLWGDALVRWLLPRIGAVPVYHVKVDANGIRNIRTILRDDAYPLALAPEGQVSYRSETLPRLEQGTAQMGFWCAVDLKAAGREERVVVLPLSVHHRFDPRDTGKLMALVGRLEAYCGIDVSASRALSLRERLASLESGVFALASEFYVRTYGRRPPRPGMGESANRWTALMETALGLAENALGLGRDSPPGASDDRVRDDMITRVYRIRQECWDRVYPEDEIDGACALGAALANRRAGEAWYAMRHMEFVDIAWYLDSGYAEGRPGEEPSFDRLAETAFNLDDLVSRLAGGNIASRSRTMRRKAVIIPGAAMDMTARLPDYLSDRKSAVKAATADLDRAFLDCVKEYLDG